MMNVKRHKDKTQRKGLERVVCPAFVQPVVIKNIHHLRNLLLIDVNSDLVLQSLPTLFQRDLGAIMKELERIRGEAWHLSRTYPQVKENIMERLTDVDECWENLDKKFLERKARLSQAEQVQLYFNDCRELMYVLAS